MGKHHSDRSKNVSKKGSLKVTIIIGIVAAIALGGGAAAYFATSSGGEGTTADPLVGSWNDVHGVGVYDGALYLATHNGLFKKTDSGWELVGSDRSDLMGFVISPAREGVMYSSGHPPTGGNLGFRKSTDAGQTWQTISPVTSSPVDFHAMDASAVDENLIYGSPGSGSDIYVTYDEGKTWSRLSPPARVISLAAHPTDVNTVYAGTAEGLFVSNSQGKSWQKLNDDLVSSGAVTGLGFADGVMYAFVSPGQGDGHITKSLDLGKTWSKTDGQVSGARGAWKFAGGDGEVYTILIQRTIFGSTASSVYKSTDGGASWTLEGTNNKSVAG